MSAEFIVVAVGVALSYTISFPLSYIFGNSAVGIISLALTVPGFIGALITMAKKTHETKMDVPFSRYR
jgi:hypothetical protein